MLVMPATGSGWYWNPTWGAPNTLEIPWAQPGISFNLLWMGQRNPAPGMVDLSMMGWKNHRFQLVIRMNRWPIHSRNWFFLGFSVTFCRKPSIFPSPRISSVANIARPAASLTHGLSIETRMPQRFFWPNVWLFSHLQNKPLNGELLKDSLLTS